MFVWILRGTLTVLLGLTVFVALMLFLFYTGLKGFLDDDVYIDALSEANVYQRLYTEIITPGTIDDIWKDLSDDSAILSSEELLALFQTVAPPEYIQSQVEANLAQLASFSSGGNRHTATLPGYGRAPGPPCTGHS